MCSCDAPDCDGVKHPPFSSGAATPRYVGEVLADNAGQTAAALTLVASAIRDLAGAQRELARVIAARPNSPIVIPRVASAPTVGESYDTAWDRIKNEAVGWPPYVWMGERR